MSIWRRQKTLERLEDRFARMEDHVSSLQRESKKLDLEFTDLYDRVRRQMSRMAKRYAVDQKENGEEQIETPADDGVDPISRSILLRRGLPRMKP